MTYWEEMKDLQVCQGQLSSELENPFSCPLSLRGPASGDIKDRSQTESFIPNPLVIEIFQNEETLGELPNIRVQNRRFKVEGISKNYDRTFFDRQNTDLILTYQGKDLICKVVEIKEESLTWTLTIEENIGKQKLPIHQPY